MDIEQIKNITVIGGGLMGTGIAQTFVQAGLSIRIVDLEEKLLERCLAQIRANLKLLEEYGLIQEDISAILSRVRPILFASLDESLDGSDFVIEAIPENLRLKRDLFARLDRLAPEIILTSNTSSYTISSLTEEMVTPQRVVGLHYFNPAYILPLVEVHRGEKTTKEALELSRQLMIKTGKRPVMIRKEIPGFVVNRIQAAIGRETTFLVSEGVITPEDIDIASKASYGLRLACIGQMENSDLLGLDTVYRASMNIYKDLNNATVPAALLEEKVMRGELGVKSGKGWYDYSGKTMAEILEQRDRKLLQVLALSKQMEQK